MVAGADAVTTGVLVSVGAVDESVEVGAVEPTLAFCDAVASGVSSFVVLVASSGGATA